MIYTLHKAVQSKGGVILRSLGIVGKDPAFHRLTTQLVEILMAIDNSLSFQYRREYLRAQTFHHGKSMIVLKLRAKRNKPQCRTRQGDVDVFDGPSLGLMT
jgi:hypothetical protein